MAATVINGLTNVTLANNNTGFSVWKRDGTGGTPSAISETDVFLQGTGSCSVRVSNQGVALAYGTGGLNLSASGTHVYIWANMLAGGLMANRASNGLCIILSSDATLSTGSNYSMWAVDGADTYPGGWVRYVIDISKTRTTGAGTLNLSSVQHIGMYCDTRPNTAKFDNLVIDRIDYAVAGNGLRVYGTSTTDDLFQDILDADEGTINNKYGIVTSKEGIIYVRGTIELGDDTGTNAATLTDTDKVVVFETPTYYDGTSEAQCISSTFQQLKIVGNGTGATSVTLGKKVGTGDTASGRNGLTFIESGSPVTVDFDDGNANTVNVYGSTFFGITGGLSWGTNTAHECIGNSFSSSTQFDPVGGIEIRNCSFVGTADVDAALLWNSNIDIKNTNFIANTTGAGIEHPAQGTFTYDGLNFSGNSNDILYSAAASSGVLTVNSLNGSNPTTSEIANATGNSVTINNAVSVKITATNVSGTAINGARVRMEAANGGNLPSDDLVSITASGTTATVTHTSHGLTTGDKVIIRGTQQDEYTKIASITVTDANTYTYTIDSGATSPATPATATSGNSSTSTYFFDGSDVAAFDSGATWSDVTNADDGNLGTFAFSGAASSSTLSVEGTNAPADGGEITQVRFRVYGKSTIGTTITATVYEDGGVNSLGVVSAIDGNDPAWSSYTTLSTHSGGWTWAKLQALEVDITSTSGAGNVEVNRIEIEVTSGPAITSTFVILDGATDGTGIIEDTGFNFTANQPVRGVVRSGSGSPYYKTSQITGTITSSGLDQTILLISDE